MTCNLIAMQALVRLYGTGHHLALPHIVFWSPLLVYFFLRQRRIMQKTLFGIWAGLLFATDAVLAGARLHQRLQMADRVIV